MELPGCIANIRLQFERDGGNAVIQTPMGWSMAGPKLAAVLETTVTCAARWSPDTLEYAVDDMECVVETLDDLAPKLYRSDITIARGLLLAHSGRFAEADHMLTEHYRVLNGYLRTADSVWASIVNADLALVQAAKGRILDWRVRPAALSLVRYKAALNRVRRSARTQHQAFVHGIYDEALEGRRRVAVADYLRDIQLQLRQQAAGKPPAILNERLWTFGLGSTPDRLTH